MSSPLISAYLISVGILLMAAAHASILARGIGHARENWSFAAICLGFAGFQFCNALQYSAPDHARALAAHLWVNFFSLLVIPPVALAAAALDPKKRSRQPFVWLTGFVLLVMAYNFLTPYGYRFHALNPDTPRSLPWGENIHMIQGQASLVYRAARLVLLIVLAYALGVTFSLMRMKDRLSSTLIWIGLAIMLVTLLLSSLSDIGVISLPHLGGFGFVFLAGAFSLVVRKEMRVRELQEKHNALALAREVQERLLADARADQILHHDALTGLPNRAGFIQRLEHAIEQHGSAETKIAVLLFDIDHLGAVKGTHGLATGDELLLQVSQRLRARIRDRDVLARSRSDGFALIASRIKAKTGVSVLCEKLSGMLAEAVELEGQHFKLSASIGLAIYPDDASSAGELLSAAELALHEAKNAGVSQIRSFHPALKENFRQRIGLESALREALERKQFFLCYQPQVSASTGRTVGMEALLRWQHPELGLVSPLHFIPLAEANGLISHIGAWVIDTACAQLAAWRQAGHADLRMAVNLSATQLLNPYLEDTLLGAIASHGLVPADLELEITESVLIQDPDQTVLRFNALRKLGLRLSIDDFGTGYSSLSYLRVLPVQAFKLDRSFVEGLGKDETSLEICASAIRLAQNLNLDIVAEGVETSAQAEWLRALGCPIFQGFLFARPLMAEAATAHLAQERAGGITAEAAGTELPRLPSVLAAQSHSGLSAYRARL
ncbi:putative bifunctional diguanylate cyclase/phosphodiesterase [Uliginosibacterium aquaticum]|uniref:Bifunctional diguanylate cyclase/phosphodiesterase n=1 Tax=Uliginosibacterium aquaticum TaxID=2731212 RepID=A0ABX2IPH8_9RHOO|nr:bifunctional diguanylate cyclase/phosphodiesterase [Uliginosibacterium aquaticum]NSL55900.1 bifunctional diguanylate cyclase/phosphodiesterase [Uliginosibacterium aquaticum]